MPEATDGTAGGQTPIAIVGMACRFPGAPDVDAYWRLLRDGIDAITDVPESRRWEKSRYFDPDPDAPGRTYVWQGGFLADVESFDASFFGISPREAVRMDPQQRLLLECVWRSIEDAGIAASRLDGTATGMYVGVSTNDFLQIGCRLGHPGDIDAYSGTGTATSIASGRLSYCLGLQGPNFPVDTACSSALVAIHQACQGLRAGDCDTAITAAVNLMLSPETTVYFSKVRALAADGRCRAFDAAASGYVRSEGVAAVVLRRLDDAVRDGLRILAVIRGSAINHDGRTTGLTVPNGDSQERLIRKALGNAGVRAREIGYVEAHGTGTPLGDPIEVRALGGVFAPDRSDAPPLVIGSAKTNIGHTEAVSGLAGLIKIVLALRHRTIPRHLHFDDPSPHIPWARLPLRVAASAQPWDPIDGRRLAGVSSFGFSGTNAHVIVEEPPSAVPGPAREPQDEQLLVLSAKTPVALKEAAAALASRLEGPDCPDLADLCYTAAHGRAPFPHRAAARVTSRAEAAAAARHFHDTALERPAATRQPRQAWLFPGDGPVRIDTGAALLVDVPVFRAAIDECAEAVAEHLGHPLVDLLTSPPLERSTTDVHVGLFAIEYALARMWTAWGLRPTVVAGHSIGEFVAAVVAGVMSAPAAARFLARRAILLDQLTGPGGLVAVAAAPGLTHDITVALGGTLAVAAENSLTNTVVAGSPDDLHRLEATLAAERIAFQRLHAAHAYHSPSMDGMVDACRAAADELELRPPRIGMVSSVTGRLETDAFVRPDYWAGQVREPVRFRQVVDLMHGRGYRVYLEVGPAPVLTPLGRHDRPADAGLWVASLNPSKPSRNQLLDTLLQLYEAGVDPDWRGVWSGQQVSLTSLPGHPFALERHFPTVAPEQRPPQLPSAPAAVGGPSVAAERARDAEPTGEPAPPRSVHHKLAWDEAAAPVDSCAETTPGTWLVLMPATDRDPWNALRALLEQRGDKAVGVVPQSDTAAEDGTWPISDPSADGFRRLLDRCRERGLLPLRGVVFGWSAARTGELAAGDDPLEASRWGVGAAAGLIAAIARHQEAGEPRVCLVTRGAQSIDERGPVDGWVHAGVWGLGRVVPLEHPPMRCRTLDLDPDTDILTAVDEAAAIFRFASAPDGDQAVVSGNRWWVARLVELDPPGAADPPQLRADATYLVTGGLGSLGAKVAQRLVDRGARHVCLIGRAPDAETLSRIVEAVCPLGGEVEAVACDVTDAGAVDRLVAELSARADRPLAGIVHAAGVLADGAISDFGWERCASVLRPKVVGGWNLHRATASLPLDFFVCFSSVAAMLGSPKQAAYAAANAAMEALMAHRRHRGLPGSSIAWGPWLEEGMAARMGERQLRSWSRMGIEPLSTAEALSWFDTFTAPGAVGSGVFAMDWTTFIRRVPAGLEPPVLRGIARRYRRDMPPSGAWLECCRALRTLPPTEHPDVVSRYVETMVAGALGRSDPAGIDIRAGFVDLGLDSLMAVDLGSRLQNDIGGRSALTATFIIDHPTIESVTRHLLQQAVPAVLGEPAVGPGAIPSVPHLDRPGRSSMDTVPPATVPEPVVPSAVPQRGGGHQPLASTGEAIAIVGIGCRFPGSAGDPTSYWRLLANGVDAIREVPATRWNVERWYDADPAVPGRMNCRHGGFLEGVEMFDATFFGISPREAVRLDPQHRLVLEVAVEAIESAKVPLDRLAGSTSAVYLGMSGNDYLSVLRSTRDAALLDGWLATGNAMSIAAGRVSHALGWHGPCMTIDTACSSSLVAVHLAVQCLRAGKTDFALAGGVGLLLGPETSISLTKAHALSPDGRCKTFDANANGYVRSEGCGLVALKRLDDALAGGDPILAIIRGTAINHDGRSGGLTVPNVSAQEAVLRDALADGRISPQEVDYVEAHGTGTPLGDPIEMQAIQSVYASAGPRARPLSVGSVKTNLGHLEAAAGVAGLIKAVLSLHHGAIPPHLHFRQPSPYIPWGDPAVNIPTRLEEWPRGAAPRRAAVSSFGFSGTNAHVVIEEAPASNTPAPETDAPPGTEQVLCLTAKSAVALEALASTWADILATTDADWRDLCFSASAGRTIHAHRLAVTAVSAGRAIEPLHAFTAKRRDERWSSHIGDPSRRPKVAFLFTGQGSQYAGMGRALYEAGGAFRAEIDGCDAILGEAHGVGLREAMFAPTVGASIDRTDLTQVTLFCLEIAVFRMWESLGVRPGAVLGHSVGELAAACCAGVFTLEDGLRMVVARGRLMAAIHPGGAMAVVIADRKTVADVLERVGTDVEIAALNGPRNTVVSGSVAGIDTAMKGFLAGGLFSKRLSVSHACHSRIMDPMLAEFAAVVRGVALHEPTIGMVSDLSGRFVSAGEVTTADYWVRQIREPVEFAAGIRTLADQRYSVFLEVGPDPVLVGMGRQCVDEPGVLWQATLDRRRKSGGLPQDVLRDLFLHGVDLDWRQVHGRRRRWVDIPGYPFQRQRFWPLPEGVAPDSVLDDPTGVGGTRSGSGNEADHPFLGRIFETEAIPGTVFDTTYDAASPSFVAEHQVHGLVVVPGAAYLSMAVAAACHRGREGVRIDDVVFPEPMFLPPGEPRQVQVVLRPAGADEECRITSRIGEGGGGRWRTHAKGLVRDQTAAAPETPLLEVAAVRERCRSQTAAGEDFYEALSRAGVQLGPAFKWNDELWRCDGEALTRMDRPRPGPPVAGCSLQPGLLDSCIQIAAAALPFTHHDYSAYVPVAIERFIYLAEPAGPLWCHAVIRADERASRGTFTSDVHLHDDSGRLIVEFSGLRMQRAPRTAIMAFANRRLREWMYRLSWIEKPRPPADLPEAGGKWLVFADRQGLGNRVVRLLEARGGACTVVRPGRNWSTSADGSIRIDPRDRSHWDRLLGEASSPAGHWVGIAFLWPVDGGCDGLEALTVRRFDAAQTVGARSVLELLQAIMRASPRQPPRLTVVTRGTQATGRQDGPIDVPHASIWGMARVAALEIPQLPLRRIDLSSLLPAARESSRATSAEAVALAAELIAPDGEDQIALRGDTRLVARLARGTTGAVRTAQSVGPGGQEPYRLAKPVTKSIEDLDFQPVGRLPPANGEIEIAVRATGLNFRDVLNTLGLYPGEAGPLGFECAGFVSAVGNDVTHVAVGDRVVALAPGSLGPFVLTDARLATRIPDHLSFEEAATLPIVFLTVRMAVGGQARLSANDTVLVHSAAGGVGLATVQLARQVGARVIATAGSEEKRNYLRGIGIEHVFDSRSADFPDLVRAATGGRGVDVVINALPGEHVGWNLAALAIGGRFVEIGKSDTWASEGWAEKRPDVGYSILALDDLSINQPSVVGTHLQTLVEDVSKGVVKPLPHTDYDMEHVRDAFRFMAQSRHIGKVIVTQRDFAASRAAEQRVHAEATYLITGGLGALGLLVARWLMEHGARHVVLGSRRPPDEAATKEIEEMRSRGVEIVVAAIDLSRPAQLRGLVRRIRRTMPPIAGVVHAAGVLDDALLVHQDWARFERVMEAKVRGAIVLHELSRESAFDWLILFSSIASMWGSPGQANYASANAVLDALAHARRQQGAPAVTINWGPWAEVGMAARMDAGNRHWWQVIGIGMIPPGQGMTLMEMIVQDNPVQVAVIPVDWKKVVSRMQVGQTPALISDLVSDQRPPLEASREWVAFVQEMNNAPPAERIEMLVRHIQTEAARVLGLDDPGQLDPHAPLQNLGFDSLMAVELANQMTATTGLSLPVTLLVDHPTLHAVARYIVRSVLKLTDGSEAEPAVNPMRSTSGDPSPSPGGSAVPKQRPPRRSPPRRSSPRRRGGD